MEEAVKVDSQELDFGGMPFPVAWVWIYVCGVHGQDQAEDKQGAISLQSLLQPVCKNRVPMVVRTKRRGEETARKAPGD